MISYDVTEFGAPLKRTERPTPQPQGTEVLIRTLAAGICHSDLHIWEGGFDLGSAGKQSVIDAGVKLPITMGHEIVGEITALGADAVGLELGEKRLVYPWIGCGDCAVCRQGREHLCTAPRYLGMHRPGGYSDHVLVPHPHYLIPIGSLRPEEAAPYACSGLTAFGALRKLNHLIEHVPIVIIGAGGLGLMSLILLHAMGGKGAIVIDKDASKRDAAVEAGALAVIDSAAADAADQTRKAADGGVLGVIDFGARPTVQLGIDVLAKGGKLLIVGLIGGDIRLPLPLLPMREIGLQGSFTGSLAELKDLMALVDRARPKPIPVICRPLCEANDALQDLRDGKAIGRLLLTPQPARWEGLCRSHIFSSVSEHLDVQVLR